MKNPVSQATLVAGFLALAASTGMAQLPYRAELQWSIGGVAASGGSSASAVLAQVKGACDGLPNDPQNCGDSNFQERAGAVSQPSSLSGYGLGWASPAVSAGGTGFASYLFEDVVFTDETNPGSVVPVSVALSFTAEATQGGNTPFGTLNLYVTVSSSSGTVAQWQAGPQHPDEGIPLALGTTSLALQTNTVYELEITAQFSGGGNQNVWEYIEGSVVWNDPPFILAEGFTANSAQAGIVDNNRAFPVPVTTPGVSTNWPLVAGASGDSIYFSDGQSGSPGVYVVAGLPTGAPVQFDVFATFDLLPNPFIPVPFTADGDGKHNLELVTTPSLSGFSLGVQAFQYVLGPPDGWYSSNPWIMTFQ